MTDIEKLINGLTFTSNTMTSVKCGIKGLAFFPGGKGTTDNTSDLSNKPIMILGQDFDTETKFNNL